MHEKFFELLKYSVGAPSGMEQMRLSDEEWSEMYLAAKRQALIGVCFNGLQRLPKKAAPPRKLKMQWWVDYNAVVKKSAHMNKCAVHLCSGFRRHGFYSCLLKGQGNALMYPDPLARESGDADVWVVPKAQPGERLRIDDRAVMAYVRKRCGRQHFCYHHIASTPYHDADVEVHYRPSFMNNPWHNRRLQQYFGSHIDEQFVNQVAIPGDESPLYVPTDDFNIVFQMSHLSNHFFNEGLGLRQVMDYYYLLKRWHERPDASADATAGGRKPADEDWARLFRHLGLYRYARAIMWVLGEVLGMPEAWMLVPKDERLGRFLLREMMLAGNFGQHDQRVQGFMRENTAGRNLQRLKRDARLLWKFPSECLWEPVFRLWHWTWRLRHR